MTPCQKVYDAFLSKVTDDEWSLWTEDEVNADLAQILAAAIVWFKFPRVSLDVISVDSELYFDGDLSNNEIQILAAHMRCEWLNRCIMDWRHVKPLYEERDFSEANMLSKLDACLSSETILVQKLEDIYYRSRDGKPFNYSRLAGD